MIINLSNGKEIEIADVTRNPKAEATRWLRERKERKNEDLLLQAHGDAIRSQLEEAQGSDHTL